MTDQIRALQRDLVEGITEYMKGGDFDAGYTQEHIDRCNETLESFFENLAEVAGENRNAQIMDVVKTTVMELNALNEETESSMIETDQREQLCEIIISSAKQAGLVSDTYDITEEWREW